MQRMLLILIVACISHNIFTEQPREEQDKNAQEMVQEGCKLIDSVFEQALTSIAAKEDIMNAAWFFKREEIKKIQNLMSDSIIIFCFDHNTANPIPERLQGYLQGKIQDEVVKLCNIDTISTKNIRDFYELSHIVCALIHGRGCGRMIQGIKSENLHCLLKLEMQKSARKHFRKEEARQLRQELMLGSRS